MLQPIQAKPGRVKLEDYEYQRLGTANLFGWVEPLTGNRDVWVTERRTKLDYAQALKRLSESFPDADVIVLVQDNLNTHSKAALYEKHSQQRKLEHSPKGLSFTSRPNMDHG